MAQLIIQNNGRQPFTFYVLRTEQPSSGATIIEKIALLQGNQFHYKVDEIAGKSFSVGVGSGGEKGEPADKASLQSISNIDFTRHDRWTSIYDGHNWSVF